MKEQQIEQIAALRQCNYPYSFISRELGIPINTVKSVCRRKGLETNGPRKTKAEKEKPMVCKCCHKPFPAGTRKDTVFCSDYCRTKWRRDNRRVIEK